MAAQLSGMPIHAPSDEPQQRPIRIASLSEQLRRVTLPGPPLQLGQIAIERIDALDQLGLGSEDPSNLERRLDELTETDRSALVHTLLLAARSTLDRLLSEVLVEWVISQLIIEGPTEREVIFVQARDAVDLGQMYFYNRIAGYEEQGDRLLVSTSRCTIAMTLTTTTARGSRRRSGKQRLTVSKILSSHLRRHTPLVESSWRHRRSKRVRSRGQVRLTSAPLRSCRQTSQASRTPIRPLSRELPPRMKPWRRCGAASGAHLPRWFRANRVSR